MGIFKEESRRNAVETREGFQLDDIDSPLT